MTKKQLNNAFKLAMDFKNRYIDDDGKHLVNISVFDGFGLPNFQPVHVTLDQLAALIRWQCLQIDGEIDNNNLEEIAIAGKKKFVVLG